MGIPSYFNYVLKNHTKIIKRLNQHNCHELFIDANSIIYDVVKQSEENINQRVYDSILELIHKLKPTFTFVAFDGVAPLAKMKQQKQRRYKSWVTKQIIPSNNWNTNAITPGTTFMNDLDIFLNEKCIDYKRMYYLVVLIFKVKENIKLWNISEIIIKMKIKM